MIGVGKKPECPGVFGTRESGGALPGRSELQLCGPREAIPTHGQLVRRREDRGCPSSAVCHSQVSAARLNLKAPITGDDHFCIV